MCFISPFCSMNEHSYFDIILSLLRNILNIKSFYDVCEYAGKNIIASHSNAFALSDHRRNLNNDQLTVLKEIGG